MCEIQDSGTSAMIRSDNGYDFHILDCTEEEKHVLQEYLMKAYIDE